jgi:hypothetical protein
MGVTLSFTDCAVSVSLLNHRTELNTVLRADSLSSQTVDNRRRISDGLTSSFHRNHVVHSVHDNQLLLCNSCPYSSITRLGNDAAVFTGLHN